MRKSFKLLADGDDGTSLIGVTASMWAKKDICRMGCVTMNPLAQGLWQSFSPAPAVLSGDRTPVEFWNYVLVFVLHSMSAPKIFH